MDQPPAGTDGGLPPALLLLLLAPIAAGLMLRFRWYRLSREPLRPLVTPPAISLAFVLLLFVAGGLGLQLAAMVFAIEPGDATQAPALADHTRLAAGAYAGQLLVAGVYVLVGRLTRGDGAAAVGHGRALLLGMAGFLLWWPLVHAAGGLAAILRTWWTGSPPPDAIAHDTLRLVVDGPRDGWFVVLTLLVVTATPALEELLYRGLLQDALRRVGLGPWSAIVLVSVMFAAMHWGNTEPHAVVGLAVLSMGFGWVFERTGRLLAPIAMHAAFNAANLAIALGGSD